MKAPDIYFEDFWGELHAQCYGGNYHSYIYEDECGAVMNNFVRRPTGLLPDVYDILSPWRYSGPIVIDCKEGRRTDLIRGFERDFEQYCKDSNIVAEFVRFSPWLKNHEDFRTVYELKRFSYAIGIDLTADFFHEEFSTKRRGNVRKAQKSGVRAEIDFKCDTADEFYRLYRLMAGRNKLPEASIHSRKFIDDMISACGDRIFIINGMIGDVTASAGVFLVSDNYLHYHLCGNDPKFFGLDVNALITCKACEWGKASGRRLLDIGSSSTESLYQYKRQFTKKGFYDFFTGSRIYSNDLYRELVALKGKSNAEFFPAYRQPAAEEANNNV